MLLANPGFAHFNSFENVVHAGDDRLFGTSAPQSFGFVPTGEIPTFSLLSHESVFNITKFKITWIAVSSAA